MQSVIDTESSVNVTIVNIDILSLLEPCWTSVVPACFNGCRYGL